MLNQAVTCFPTIGLKGVRYREVVKRASSKDSDGVEWAKTIRSCLILFVSSGEGSEVCALSEMHAKLYEDAIVFRTQICWSWYFVVHSACTARTETGA